MVIKDIDKRINEGKVWNYRKAITGRNNESEQGIIMKAIWSQARNIQPVAKELQECTYCQEQIMKYKHYFSFTELDERRKFVIMITNIQLSRMGIDMNIAEVTADINLTKVQKMIRGNRILRRRIYQPMNSTENRERKMCELVMKIIYFYTNRVWPIAKKIDKND